ncbi:type II toxin-antitoxin system SpoIISA family toxin [Paenibacillus sp. SGZ-1009]|uniref:type II toxin-antitoxin system SpoIISA family toxin n=1 Tax=Paenibacillus campi TaxID=3106031 RepID=UPI002AFF657C|nr:type II toxin-antitoxin system SpoIISA family toxin [Paenibacillus sp. SGZ-1009]
MFLDLWRFLKKYWIFLMIGTLFILVLVICEYIFIVKDYNWVKKAVEIYKKSGKVYFSCFFLLMSGYLVSSVYKFHKNPENFTDDLWKYRKILYTLFIVFVGLGIICGYIDYKNWHVLLQLVAFVIFADLGVFQTPNITKIWNAEFQQRTKIEKVIEVNTDFIQSTSIKLQVFSEVITQTEAYFEPKGLRPQNWNDYQRELKQYLHLYTGKFRFKLELFHFKSELEDDVTKENIDKALSKLETLFLYEIDDTPGKENAPSQRMQFVNEFLVGKGVVVDQKKLIIVPIFGGKSALLGVRASEGSSVDDVDINNIINLVRIFHWYMT